MLQIKLNDNKSVLVDRKDFEKLINYKWTYKDGYAVRFVGKVRNGRKCLYMHRSILDASKGMEVDHINGDGLDNRRSNLRLCTRKENSRNTKIHKHNTSGYKGVVRYYRGGKLTGKWLAQIIVDGKKIYGNSYKRKEAAAKAYDSLAKKYFGKFASLNFGGQRHVS